VNRLGFAIVIAACSFKSPVTSASDPTIASELSTPVEDDDVTPPSPEVDDGAPPSAPAPILETPAPAPAPVPAAVPAVAPGFPRRVVIISEDGLRPDALNEQTAPNHLALMREGMSASRAFTIKPSETLASHASMLSGFAVADHKMNFDGYRKERGQILLPTIFSVARAHGKSTAMFIGKQKLWHLAPEGTVDHYEKPGFFCKTVGQRAARYFETNLPDLMFVHLTDPDNAGHDHGWMSPAYIAAVRESDRCVRTILDAIDRAGMASSTLVIVTADHGGSGRSHSGRGKDLDRKIPWIARGPSIPANAVLDIEMSTLDTAVTALAALQLPASPGMIGVSRFPPPAVLLRAR
jgi:hypothetical protein